MEQPTVAFVAITDGRKEYLKETLASANRCFTHGFRVRIMVDDSGDHCYGEWLRQNYPSFRIISHDTRKGLAAAVRTAWTTALATGADYVWHAEDDMVYTAHVDLDGMMAVLDADPNLAQLSLKRQPVNAEEEQAGGFIQLHTNDFYQCSGCIEHQTLFTFNPCLVPRHAIRHALAGNDLLERGVTDTLLADGFCFGIYGRIEYAPVVQHIGHTRSADWSL